MRHICIFSLMLIFLLQNLTFALDWKLLHDRADRLNLEEAIALAESESSVENFYILALVYLSKRKDKEAKAIFQKLIDTNNELIEAKWGLAEVLRRENKIEESENLLKDVLKKNPDFSPALISLAYIKYTQLDFKGCIQLASSVIKQGIAKVDLSNYARAYLLLAGAEGMLASRGGPFAKIIHGTKVLPNLKKAEKLKPNAPEVLFGLGNFYFLAPPIAGGNISKAKNYLEQAVSMDPFFVDAYVRLAQLYKFLGDHDKSKKYIEIAKEIDSENVLLQDFINGRCNFICASIKE